MMAAADGSIVITNAKAATRAGGCWQRVSTSRTRTFALTDEGRFSDYIVKGQGRDGEGERALRIKERATDSGVARKRIKVLVNETDTDNPER